MWGDLNPDHLPAEPDLVLPHSMSPALCNVFVCYLIFYLLLYVLHVLPRSAISFGSLEREDGYSTSLEAGSLPLGPILYVCKRAWPFLFGRTQGNADTIVQL